MTLARLTIFAMTLCAVARAGDYDFFEAKIRPVLVEHCYKCHSATGEKLKGGLHADTKSGLLRGGETGPAVVPGDPEKSLLIRALRYKDETLQMPPKQKLPDEVVNDFVEWIKAGAPDPRESSTEVAKSSGYDFELARRKWGFRAPTDPAIPLVRDKQWPKTPVDYFILSKLEAKSLPPATPASKAQLIRRATYDLTGLPPTAEEVAAFVKDSSPNAYPNLIERLLNSPQYGERWARHWLDVVRYTDSNDSRGIGGEADIPEAYRYRDWVVQSFNNDLPYDEFIMQQFAGDLLPGPNGSFNTNGVIATGLMAIGEWGTGDADKEKMVTDIVDDQIDVTGRAFLGVTLACARCHDHKFDPIPTEDYYSLAGIFFSSRILPNPGAKTAGSPTLRIPLAPAEEVAKRKARDEKIAALEKEIESTKDKQISALATNVFEKLADYLLAAKSKRAGDLNPAVVDSWIQYLGFGDIALFSRSIPNLLDKKGLMAWTPAGKDNPSLTVNTTDKQIDFLTIKLPAKTVAVHPSPNDAAVIAWKAPFAGNVSVHGKVTDADKECGNGIDWRLQTRGSSREILTKGLIDNDGTKTFSVGDVPIREGDFIELLILPKGDYSCDSTAIELEIRSGDKSWNLTQEMLNDPLSANPHGPWHFYDGAGQKPPELPAESLLMKWLATKDDNVAVQLQSALTKGEEPKLAKILSDPRGDFWTTIRRGIQVPAARDLAKLRENLPPALPVAHGLQEGGVPQSAYEGIHDARIHIRGRYDRLGGEAPRRFPRLFAGDKQNPIAEGSGRLRLARWLARPENPMTARVMVNRIWQHHFGEGIVRTPNNFGKLGAMPTHPELLDHLAHRFIESGWSIKAMHRLMMLSAAYQQSTIPAPKTLAADPENQLLGRANRRRLEAEELRDSLLAAADRLDLRLGGKSNRDLNVPRRTLYLMTIRSERSDYRSLFDAPDASSIVEKRITSTVAPQALFLLNNQFGLDQVKRLSERVLRETPNARVDWLYANLFNRPPTKSERERIQKFVNETPESWEALTQVLIASNEFAYID